MRSSIQTIVKGQPSYCFASCNTILQNSGSGLTGGDAAMRVRKFIANVWIDAAALVSLAEKEPADILK